VSDDERADRVYSAADLELAHLRGFVAAMAIVAEANLKRIEEILRRDRDDT